MRRLLGFAVQDPASAKQIVQRLWLARPEQPDIARLQEALAGVSALDQIRLLVARFLQARGG